MLEDNYGDLKVFEQWAMGGRGRFSRKSGNSSIPNHIRIRHLLASTGASQRPTVAASNASSHSESDVSGASAAPGRRASAGSSPQGCGIGVSQAGRGLEQKARAHTSKMLLQKGDQDLVLSAGAAGSPG